MSQYTYIYICHTHPYNLSALSCYSSTAAFNDCYSELAPYTVLANCYGLVSTTHTNSKTTPINNNAPIIVNPHLPQIGQWVGIYSNLSACPRIFIVFGIAIQNVGDLQHKIVPRGEKFVKRLLQIPNSPYPCPTWGRWGMTMIGA